MNLFTNDEQLDAMDLQSLEMMAALMAAAKMFAEDLRGQGMADVQVTGLVVSVALASSWPGLS